jgi:hypothetical protein
MKFESILTVHDSVEVANLSNTFRALEDAYRRVDDETVLHLACDMLSRSDEWFTDRTPRGTIWWNAWWDAAYGLDTDDDPVNWEVRWACVVEAVRALDRLIPDGDVSVDTVTR